jgi:hypothetical protein
MGDSPPVSIWQNWKQSRKAKITEIFMFLFNFLLIYYFILKQIIILWPNRVIVRQLMDVLTEMNRIFDT